jgi:hypothetical protein
MTKTDETFEADKPGYWIYDEEVYVEKCLQCGKEFETQLELNRFCTREHQKEWLKQATTIKHGV